MVKDEQVLGVSEDLISNLGGINGFESNVDHYLPAILDRTNQRFQSRVTCETDPGFKQLIPYVILTTGTGDELQVFQYSRGAGGGESRLHAQRSIGIGGHISTDDVAGDGADLSGADLYQRGMMREIAEEVELRDAVMPEIVGLIFDDSNDVGKVHLGIVHVVKLDSAEAKAREQEIEDAGWVNKEQLHEMSPQFETWSQLCIENVIAKL